MNCPNCGKPYSEEELYCPNCNAPLGNAIYSPVPRRRKKTGIRPSLIIIPLLFLILAAGGYTAYRYYLHTVERKCVQAVNSAFEQAKAMDFSEMDPEYRPPALQENPNVRAVIRQAISEKLSEAGLDQYIDPDSLDLDPLIDEIVADASYKVTGSQVSWNRCTVSVHVENTDFSTLPSAVMAELKEQITDTDSSLWDRFKKYITGLFDKDADKGELSEIILDLYRDAKEKAPKKSMDGEIVFGIQDRKWTVLSYDENLFYNFYGFDKDSIPINITDDTTDAGSAI